jgi:hypothetical protein
MNDPFAKIPAIPPILLSLDAFPAHFRDEFLRLTRRIERFTEAIRVRR